MFKADDYRLKIQGLRALLKEAEYALDIEHLRPRLAELEKEQENLQHRVEKLQAHYDALILAQETLDQAAIELQRQFAPRISKRAAQILNQLTGGRYDRLTMDQDMNLHAGAGDENTLHPWIWRSEGTIDQLYLALRLAVAEELTPEAPLVLDDALVRFDETRLSQAMEILTQAAIQRQVILFSCQNREILWKNE